MATRNIINPSSQVEVVINGSPASADVRNSILEVVIEQNTHVPDYCLMRLTDRDYALIDGSELDLTASLEVSAERNDGTKALLFNGEITALEPIFGLGNITELVVEAYDKSHRLFREVRSEAYLNVKDSDLASQLMGNAGLSSGQIDSTSTVYEHVYQHNQSDLAFLSQRAWRIGFECFVDDGKLYFRKPDASGAAAVTLAVNPSSSAEMGLLSFRPRVSLAEQVDEVSVRGWDVDKKQSIVGRASSGELHVNAQAGGDTSKHSSFGTGKQVVVDEPVVSQAEADVLAQARLNERSGVHIEAEGVAEQRPDIKAGIIVELKGIGTKYSGKYFVTGATHRYVASGLETTFFVRGLRTGLFADEMLHQEPLDRWPGVLIGIVTNTDDPNDWARVKVKFPTLSDDAESDWARVMGNGAGKDRGFFVIPDVGDEVLVAFEHGDFSRPIVIGGVWNGQDTIPPQGAGAAAGEKPLVRVWHSINGNYIAMHDDADQKIHIATIDGHEIILDDTNKKIEIKSSGGHSITIDDQGKSIDVKSSGGHKMNMDDNGRSMTMESTGNMTIKAGMKLELTASAGIDISTSAITNIKGSVVNIN